MRAIVEKDPDNQYLWRFRIQRLDAEIVRDAMMAVSGALELDRWAARRFSRRFQARFWHRWTRASGGGRRTVREVWRRSVYVYRKRGLPFPMFEVFDLPDQNLSCGRRNVSTVPTQALTLLNDEFVLRQAKLFADRVSEAAPDDPAKQVELAYRDRARRGRRAKSDAKLAADFLAEAIAGGFHARADEPERIFVHAVNDEAVSGRRRDFLFQSGGGLSGLALACLLDQDGLLAAPRRAPARRRPRATTRTRRRSRISRRAPRA